MAIYLDEQLREYLKDLLAKHGKEGMYWCADRLKSQIEKDEQRLEIISDCEHKFGVYSGKKECCVFCGTHSEGMGESWTLENPTKPTGSPGSGDEPL